MGVVKNGRGHSYRNLKLGVYQNKLMNYTNTVHADTNSGKLKDESVILIRFWLLH